MYNFITDLGVLNTILLIISVVTIYFFLPWFAKHIRKLFPKDPYDFERSYRKSKFYKFDK